MARLIGFWHGWHFVARPHSAVASLAKLLASGRPPHSRHVKGSPAALAAPTLIISRMSAHSNQRP